MLERLSDFLRATLKVPDSPLVSLSMEFSLARQYLEVMKTRLEDRLQFVIECTRARNHPRSRRCFCSRCSKMIEHGQDPVSGNIDVRLEASRQNGFVTISTRDRDRGFPEQEPASNGHGLSNARQRLKTVYRDRASMDFAGDSAGGARVDVRIPA